MFSQGHAAKLVLLAAGQALRASAECAFRVGEFVPSGRKDGEKLARERERSEEPIAGITPLMSCKYSFLPSRETAKLRPLSLATSTNLLCPGNGKIVESSSSLSHRFHHPRSFSCAHFFFFFAHAAPSPVSSPKISEWFTLNISDPATLVAPLVDEDAGYRVINPNNPLLYVGGWIDRNALAQGHRPVLFVRRWSCFLGSRESNPIDPCLSAPLSFFLGLI